MRRSLLIPKEHQLNILNKRLFTQGEFMKTLLSILFMSGSLFAADFSVKSKAYQEGKTIEAAHIFNSFGCTGKNVSPDIEWKNAPKDTKSFAVTIYDPDAPTGSGWWHWTVFNIPANVHKISAGASPKSLPKGAIEGHTDFGSTGYGGPCPPAGDKAHHYILTVFAL